MNTARFNYQIQNDMKAFKKSISPTPILKLKPLNIMLDAYLEAMLTDFIWEARFDVRKKKYPQILFSRNYIKKNYFLETK